MMTDDEIIAVVKAHKEGKQIQFRCRNHSLWLDVVGVPIWEFNNNDYRVKPEPRKPREWWVHVSADGLRVDSAMWGIPMCEECVRVREVIE